MRQLFLVLALIFTAGCASSPVVKLYDGKERADDQLLTVRVPTELEILSINDRRIEGAGTMFAFGHRDLKLMPGQYRIVAYYKNIFQLNADEHEVVKSDPALFTLTGKGGDAYALTFNKPDDVNAAREMAKNFEGWSENLTTGEKLASQPSGLILNQGFIGLSVGAAAVEPAASSTIAPEPAASTDTTVTADGLLDTLKQNWQQASPEQRREFLLWMSQ